MDYPDRYSRKYPCNLLVNTFLVMLVVGAFIPTAEHVTRHSVRSEKCIARACSSSQHKLSCIVQQETATRELQQSLADAEREFASKEVLLKARETHLQDVLGARSENHLAHTQNSSVGLIATWNALVQQAPQILAT